MPNAPAAESELEHARDHEQDQLRTLVTAGVIYLLVRRAAGLLWPAQAAPPPVPAAPAPALPLLGWSLLAGPAMDLPPHLWQSVEEAKIFGRCHFLRTAAGALWWTAVVLLGIHAAGAALQYGCDMALVATDEAEHEDTDAVAVDVPDGEEEEEKRGAGDVKEDVSGEVTNAAAVGAANRNHLLPSIEDVVRHYHQYIGGAPTRRQMAWGFDRPSPSRDSPSPAPASSGGGHEGALIVSLGYPGESFWSARYWTPSDGMCALGVGLMLGVLVYVYYLGSVSEWAAVAQYYLGAELRRRMALFRSP